MDSRSTVLTPRVLILSFLFVVVAPFLPLLISQQWDWWQAWVYAIVSILGFVISRALAARRHPDLLAERARMLRHEDAKPWDKTLAPLVGLGGAAIPLVAGLDAQGVDRAALCGQSMGGYIAQHIYRLAPARVQALIMIGTTPIAKAYSRWEVWALQASLPLFRLWPYGHFTQTIARMHGRRPEVQAYMLQAARQIPRDDFVAIWQAVTVAVNEKGNPALHLDVPLLLLHGDHDRAGTIRRDMPLWAGQEQHAVYQVIPDAAHNANQDNPS